jgi:hypothetical protein
MSVNFTEKLSELGLEFLETIRERAGLSTDEEMKGVFHFIILSFLQHMPEQPVPGMKEVVERFQKALPSLTTQACLFIEQVKVTSEMVWSNEKTS